MASRTVAVNLVANVGQYVSGMNTAAGASMRLGDTADTSSKRAQSGFDMASKGALLLGGAVVGGLAMAVNAAANFEKSMSGISAATHASGAELGKFRDAAMKAGADTQYSATQAADAITEMSKAGVSSADILGGGLSGALNLAAAGQLEVADAAGIASVAMTQFSLSGKDLPHVADLLAAGAGKAMGSVDDLGQALNQSGLIASAAGLSIEETTGTLSAFANAGLIGSDAGTSFKTALQAIQAPSGKAAETMAELGINMYDSSGNMLGAADMAGVLHDKLGGLTEEQRNSALATIFGSDAVRAANVLYKEGQSGIQGWIDKVNDQGYAADTARRMNDNLKGDLERLGGSFETLMIKMGEGSQGPLRALVGGLTDVISAVAGDKAAFDSLPGPLQLVISAAGGLADLVGGIAHAFGDLPGPVQTAVITLGAVAALKGPVGGAMETIALKAMYMGDSLSGASLGMGGLKAAGSGLLGFFGGPWGLAITGVTLGLGALVSWLGKSDEATSGAKNAAREYATALEESNGAIDENVRLSAAKAALDSGVLKVGKDAGIRLSSITDAITGQSGALESVQKRLRAYIDTNTEMITTENGPVYQLNAQGEAAKKALTDLELLAGQAPKTKEAHDLVAEAAGTTTAAIAEETAQTEAQIEAQNKLGESLAAFIDPLGVYKGLLEEKKEADRAAAEAASQAATGSTESWKKFVVDSGFSFDEYMAKLEEQVTAQTNWQTNMLALSGRVSQGTLNELARMGPEGAPLVAALVNQSDAELGRFDEITALRSQEATNAWGAQLTAAAPVLAEVSKIAGSDVVAALAAELSAGTTTVAIIASNYGVKLAGGIDPLMEALGKPKTVGRMINAQNYARQNGLAEGGYTGQGGKYEPAGIVHRGEYVLTKAQTERLGIDEIERFANSGYAEGGLVGLGRQFQARGASVSEHPLFGGVAMGGHGKTSLHHTGHAIDVNTRPGTSALEQSELAPLAALARSLGFRTIFMAPGHYNHLHVDDGGGASMGGAAAVPTIVLPTPPSTSPFADPISTGADAAMKHMYDQATAWVAENTPSVSSDAAGGATGAEGPTKEQVRAVASRYGWGSGANWDSLDRLIQGESGWNPKAANPSSSARGLFQKMTSLHGPIEPTAAGQAEWGLKYIKGAYGSPSAAYAKWSSRKPHWYDDGGILPPGLSMSYNGTGANEQKAVFTTEQWRTLQSLTSREFSGGSGGIAGGGSVSIPAPVVKVYLDGQEWRGMARIEAEGVVIDAFTGSANRGRNNS